MKTKIFSIEVIEEGRLTKVECNEIVGGVIGGGNSGGLISGGNWGSVSFVGWGLVGSYKPACSGIYLIKECYVYTYCSAGNIDQTGYENCPSGTEGAYTICPSNYQNQH